MPPTPRSTALYYAVQQRRTPRIHRVVQSGSASVQVVFDRPMDGTKSRGIIRTFDSTNGILEWTDGTWLDERTWESSTSSQISPSFTGTRRVIYMGGDLRAKGRYPVPLRERCDRVEDDGGDIGE